MVWLIVALGVMFLGLIIYFCLPLFKKIRINKETSRRKEKRQDRQERKQAKLERKQEKRERQKVVKLERKKNENKNTVIENKDDLFNENAVDLNQKFEDPDTKINYDNFDLGGLFEDERPQQQNDFQTNDEDLFASNYEELFNKYFADERTSKSSVNSQVDKKFDIEDILNKSSSRGDIKDLMKDMSPEMKALMLSNFLDKKDY